MMDEREDVEDGTEAAAMNASSGSSSSHSHHHAHVFSERHQRGATDDQEEEGHTSVVSTSPTAMVQAALPEDVDSWVHEFMRWTSERQSQAADALIAAIQQRDGEGGLRLLYRRVHSFLHVDFLAMLPEELAINVLRFLDTRSVCTCAMVSKRWRRVVNLDRVWKPRVLQDFNPHTLEVLINRTKHILPHRLTWKQMYELRYRCETQWQSPTVATQPRHTFRGHTGVVTCLISVGDDRVLSGDTNGALHVTCLRTQRLVGQLQGHSQGVWCLDVDGTTAVSGSCDRTVRVWDLERLQCLHVLRGHTSTVRCVAITDGLVFSGARDAAVRVWDVATGNCLHTLVEHTDSVRCLAVNDRYLVSGSYDSHAIVWSRDTFSRMHTLSGHTYRIYSLELRGHRLATGSLDTTIRIWNTATGTCDHVLTGHTQLTIMMVMTEDMLVSANADNTLRVWDLNTGQCKLVLAHHQASICRVILSRRAIFSCAKDGTVRVWDRKTGRHLHVLADFLPENVGQASPPQSMREQGRCTVWQMVATETQLVMAVGWHSSDGTVVHDTYLAMTDVLPNAAQDLALAWDLPS